MKTSLMCLEKKKNKKKKQKKKKKKQHKIMGKPVENQTKRKEKMNIHYCAVVAARIGD